MKSWKKPTNEMIDRALGSVKKETDRQYFFSRLKNPMWIQPLAERGYFQSPPNIRSFDDGSIQFPFWPELHYLKNVSNEAPDEVINLVLSLPKVDNSRIYDGILEIALQLHGEQSVKLKPKILEYTSMENQLSPHKYADLLAYWAAGNQTSAALELLKELVAFAPDPQSEDKQKRRKENPMNFGATLYPSPRFNSWGYSEILTKGVPPLAEKDPYKVACLLIHATENMIRLRIHQADLDKSADLSEIWCPRLHGSNSNHEDPEKALSHALAFACEKVYEKSPNTIADLDRRLRKQQWTIFKRLRQHLYARYPNEQTKPWIRELILEREDYDQAQHSYEFQQMIQQSCEHFGETLLRKKERIGIFNAIYSGPSKEDFRDFMGEKFTEEDFQKRQHYFHRQQFKPFTSVLFGKYKTHFQKLEAKADDPISEEDYLPFKTVVGSVSNRSPRSSEDLANLTDEALLIYINDWEKKDRFSGRDPFVEINIEALASTFQTVFRQSIIPDTNRLRFWMKNRESIERPIYVRMMINAMQASVKEKNFYQLNEWLTFCEWVLSHSDRGSDTDYRLSDESRENPHWANSRRAVTDFIGVCLEKDVDVPITAREQLAKILEMLCTQYDRRLDENKPTILSPYDPLTEGINNTRSRTLEELVKFGFWLRRQDSDTDASSEVTTILEKRFDPGIEHPLTLPEYAVLGMNYPWIVNLNKTWAIKHKSDFFPREVLSIWIAAFESLVKYSEPSKTIFQILRDDFNFALEHLTDFKKRDLSGKGPIDILGEHLFTYYLWEMYPLEGEESLLDRYYEQTNSNREHWANLFNDIGYRLSNSGGQLTQNLKDRIADFFKWRLKEREETELRQFTFWLEAECLEAEWRLDAYSKILDICKVEDGGIRLGALCKMLPDYTAQVVECFSKLTDGIKDDNIYIRTQEAKIILKAGLKSSNKNVHRKAERSRDNLLRAGRFDLLDMDD